MSDKAERQDEAVEKLLRNESRMRRDRKKSSIEPTFLESEPEYENAQEESGPDAEMTDVDFNELSSDKEEDTTEGEITDTHTSD